MSLHSYTIICPWGTNGIGALDEQDNYFSCPIFSNAQHKVIDTLGAGDTFAAAAIYALSIGRPLEFAIQFGSQIAGEKVAFYGYDTIGSIFQKYLK